MRCIALVALLACGACAVGYRVGTSASVDDRGHPGAMLTVGASFAPFVRDKHAVLVTATLEGGVVQPRPVVGELRGALAVEWLARWQHLAVRVGPEVGFSHRDETGVILGGRLAILPTLRTRTGQKHGCAEGTYTLHLGLAAAADYDWGSHHGLFLVGPSFEGYVDLCD